MNEEQQRIAIAKACGWTHFEPDTIQYTARRSDGKWELIPDYLNDLNAMHEAEKVVEKEVFYMMNLVKVMQESGTIGTRADRTYRATAAQRAEAFLKTLNLWKP